MVLLGDDLILDGSQGARARTPHAESLYGPCLRNASKAGPFSICYRSFPGRGLIFLVPYAGVLESLGTTPAHGVENIQDLNTQVLKKILKLSYPFSRQQFKNFSGV